MILGSHVKLYAGEQWVRSSFHPIKCKRFDLEQQEKPHLIIADAGRRIAIPTTFVRAHAHNMRVDGARNAIQHFQIKFRQSVRLVDAGVGDVAEFNDIPDDESLNGFVLFRR